MSDAFLPVEVGHLMMIDNIFDVLGIDFGSFVVVNKNEGILFQSLLSKVIDVMETVFADVVSFEYLFYFKSELDVFFLATDDGNVEAIRDVGE